MIQVGDIAFVTFPFEEKQADRVHPVLVLEVMEHSQCIVAYGSSKQVDANCPRNGEVVVSDPEHLRHCGLTRPTRFDLCIRARLFVPRRSRVGVLPAQVHGRLYSAAITVGLLGA